MQIDCIFYKNGYHFTQIDYFITQILPENIKSLTGILPDFCLNFTVGGGEGGYTSHLAKNAKIKPKFLPFPSVNCFKTLHISKRRSIEYF
jgi:hypothetical protein